MKKDVLVDKKESSHTSQKTTPASVKSTGTRKKTKTGKLPAGHASKISTSSRLKKNTKKMPDKSLKSVQDKINEDKK